MENKKRGHLEGCEKFQPRESIASENPH